MRTFKVTKKLGSHYTFVPLYSITVAFNPLVCLTLKKKLYPLFILGLKKEGITGCSGLDVIPVGLSDSEWGSLFGTFHYKIRNGNGLFFHFR